MGRCVLTGCCCGVVTLLLDVGYGFRRVWDRLGKWASPVLAPKIRFNVT